VTYCRFMGRFVRLIDFGVGLVVVGWVTVYIDAPWPVAAAVSFIAGLSGVAWRRPEVSVGLAAAATLLALRWGGVSGSGEWNVALFFVSAASLGAYARLPFAALGIVAMALVVAWGERFDWGNLLFGAFMMGSAAGLARATASATRRARASRAQVERLAAATPEGVARRAVLEERQRLATDVQRVVHRSVTAMREHAGAAAGLTGEAAVDTLRSVQQEGQQAISELRRLLGLLRDDPGPPPEQPKQHVLPKRWRPWWTDVLATGALVALAVTELSLYGQPLPGRWAAVAPWSVVLTGLGAASFSLRRKAPGAGAAALGCVLVVAELFGVPVSQGFWWGFAIVGLTWSSISRLSLPHASGVLMLQIGISVYLMAADPDNLFVSTLLIVAVAVTAFVTTSRRVTVASADSASASLAAEHSEASERAVRAERLAVARELHDVVSHAVVVMVLQAGAAEALLPTDPEAASRAWDLIDRTSRATLDELDRLLAAVAPDASDVGGPDLLALIQRMRAGGLDIDFHADGAATAAPSPVAYRIVQETLTNALRYAPGAQVRVRMTEQDHEITVEVTDDGPGPRSGTRRGYGLIGMTERVEHITGSVETGPGPDGTGFRVAARLPKRTRERS